ncbi:hypothetical protein HAX54_049167, partial [Datura stramonium]|nr:hypothetical protein [Datura stramonium]
CFEKGIESLKNEMNHLTPYFDFGALSRRRVPICIELPHQTEVVLLRLGKDVAQSQLTNLVSDGVELKCEAAFVNPILRSLFGLPICVELC